MCLELTMSKKNKKLSYFEIKRKLKRLANSNEPIELQLKAIKSLSDGFIIQGNTIQNDYL